MKNLKNNKKLIMLFVILIISLVVPAFVKSSYLLHIFILIFLYAAAACSWNIIGGYAGQVSLGHAAYFGIGAYTSTLLYLNFGINPWIGMLAGAVLSALFAFLISHPCFKLRGPFFTLATLAFAEVLRLICIWARPITGGQVGLTIKFSPSFINMQFIGKVPYYYISLIIMFAVLVISLFIERSKFGYYLTALKENHDASEALGINTTLYKTYAVCISAILTAICGSFFAQLILYIEPAAVFTSHLSNQFAMIAVVGGAGTAWGPIIGAIILTPLNEILRGALGGSYQGLNYVIFGFILILVVTYMPDGIVGFYNKHKRKKL
jgi:branched-chain amino acid transport system permease protein